MKLIWGVPEEMITSQNTDGLQGFTQTHIITQDPMKLVLVQKCQPVHTILQKRMRFHLRLKLFFLKMNFNDQR